MLVPLTILALTVLDQWSKAVVNARFALGESLPLIPGFFHLTYVRNTGAAWGLFAGFSAWLTLFSMVALVVIIVFRHRFVGDCLRHRLAFACLLSGVIGNLIDRLRYAYVIDFLDFHYRSWSFPVFNVADSAICVGAGLYLLDAVLLTRRDQHVPQASDGS